MGRANKPEFLFVLAPFTPAPAEQDPSDEAIEVFRAAGERDQPFDIACGEAIFLTVGRAGGGARFTFRPVGEE